ncbi:MAG: DNA-binding protein [Chloroflexi bacterium CG_4_10_14_0_8_um_filter_57_5]|nr:MAG: DNA-binding protein [Anaerolineae bacterium CG_4_8_14_3_um_filter_59_70]PIZ26198.1 MAG: DNA-binding protein [Chloroflexi bacterium CG_4_10_14_0_8_um_filter_57_5]PJH76110.1 MAG: DNA-binding protein [Anaerolineae bacterium CG_4_9_14_0_8_um_filter_58_9]
MTPEIEELLERAKLSQKAAANLLRDGFANFAASRAYYSMFYMALLLFKGLSFSTHSAVIAAYGKEFAKTKLLDPEFHRLLLEAQDRRNIGDYGMIGGIEEKEAQEIIDWSKKFSRAAEKYFTQAF